MLFAAFRPQEIKKSQPLSGAPHDDDPAGV
jgi:hypothetical protein